MMTIIQYGKKKKKKFLQVERRLILKTNINNIFTNFLCMFSLIINIF